MQPTLAKWFKGVREIAPEKKIDMIETRYFYLSWKPGKSYPQEDARWINKTEYQSISDTITIEKQLKLTLKAKEGEKKPNVEVVICGDIDLTKPRISAYSDLDGVVKDRDFREWCNPSLLKSFLQKCIRRGWEDKAIRTAFHLMRLNMMEFLRRFVIISIEDSSTHPSLSTILWFMAIGEITYRREYIRYFLGIVYWVAITQERNVYLPQESLELRMSFGGMKGDMNMLAKYIGQEKPLDKYSPIKSIIVKRYLGLYEMDVCGADFHVFPQMIDMLWQKHGMSDDLYSKDNIKKAIWIYSSSLNIRNSRLPSNKDLDTIWKSIRDDFQKISKQLIFSRG